MFHWFRSFLIFINCKCCNNVFWRCGFTARWPPGTKSTTLSVLQYLKYNNLHTVVLSPNSAGNLLCMQKSAAYSKTASLLSSPNPTHSPLSFALCFAGRKEGTILSLLSLFLTLRLANQRPLALLASILTSEQVRENESIQAQRGSEKRNLASTREFALLEE